LKNELNHNSFVALWLEHSHAKLVD